MHTYMYKDTHLHYIHMHIHIHIHIHIYIYIYTYIHTYTHIHIHIHTSISGRASTSNFTQFCCKDHLCCCATRWVALSHWSLSVCLGTEGLGRCLLLGSRSEASKPPEDLAPRYSRSTCHVICNLHAFHIIVQDSPPGAWWPAWSLSLHQLQSTPCSSRPKLLT